MPTNDEKLPTITTTLEVLELRVLAYYMEKYGAEWREHAARDTNAMTFGTFENK